MTSVAHGRGLHLRTPQVPVGRLSTAAADEAPHSLADPTARPARERRGTARTLPAAWPIYALLYGYPLWWATGLQAFIWPLLALPMAAWLLRCRPVLAPRGTGLILLFLAWVVLSGLQLDTGRQALSSAYRLSLYVSAVVLFLFAANLSTRQLPVAKLAQAVGFLWVVAVLGGFAGLAFPGFAFTSPVEWALPQSVARDPFVFSLVHPELSSRSILLGYDIARPKAPFNYTNGWGSNFALLLPLAIYSYLKVPKRWWRVLIAVLIVPSIVPVIISINRGLWLSLTVAAAYMAARAAGRGRLKMLAGVLAVAALAVMLVAFTPLSRVVLDRADASNLDGRLFLYEQSIRATLDSPVLGHGAPIPSQIPGLTANASVGTHGQLWTVLVSQGVPGTLLLVGFFVVTLVLTYRVSRHGLWPHSVLVIVLVQMPFYNMLPVQLHIVMIAAALCWRDVLGGRWPADGRPAGRARTALRRPPALATGGVHPDG